MVGARGRRKRAAAEARRLLKRQQQAAKKARDAKRMQELTSKKKVFLVSKKREASGARKLKSVSQSEFQRMERDLLKKFRPVTGKSFKVFQSERVKARKTFTRKRADPLRRVEPSLITTPEVQTREVIEERPRGAFARTVSDIKAGRLTAEREGKPLSFIQVGKAIAEERAAQILIDIGRRKEETEQLQVAREIESQRQPGQRVRGEVKGGEARLTIEDVPRPEPQSDFTFDESDLLPRTKFEVEVAAQKGRAEKSAERLRPIIRTGEDIAAKLVKFDPIQKLLPRKAQAFREEVTAKVTTGLIGAPFFVGESVGSGLEKGAILTDVKLKPTTLPFLPIVPTLVPRKEIPKGRFKSGLISALKDPQFRKTFDPRTPEGASTFIFAGLGAFVPAVKARGKVLAGKPRPITIKPSKTPLLKTQKVTIPINQRQIFQGRAATGRTQFGTGKAVFLKETTSPVKVFKGVTFLEKSFIKRPVLKFVKPKPPKPSTQPFLFLKKGQPALAGSSLKIQPRLTLLQKIPRPVIKFKPTTTKQKGIIIQFPREAVTIIPRTGKVVVQKPGLSFGLNFKKGQVTIGTVPKIVTRPPAFVTRTTVPKPFGKITPKFIKTQPLLKIIPAQGQPLASLFVGKQQFAGGIKITKTSLQKAVQPITLAKKTILTAKIQARQASGIKALASPRATQFILKKFEPAGIGKFKRTVTKKTIFESTLFDLKPAKGKLPKDFLSIEASGQFIQKTIIKQPRLKQFISPVVLTTKGKITLLQKPVLQIRKPFLGAPTTKFLKAEAKKVGLFLKSERGELTVGKLFQQPGFTLRSAFPRKKASLLLKQPTISKTQPTARLKIGQKVKPGVSGIISPKALGSIFRSDFKAAQVFFFAQKPVSRSDTKLITRQQPKILSRPISKILTKPIVKPIQSPILKSKVTPLQKPIITPITKQTITPIQKPIITPIQKPI